MKYFGKLLAALLVAALCLSTVAALADGQVWTTGSVNMRKGPGLGYKSVRTISEGTRMEYDKTQKDDRGVKWYRITYKGRTGWISSKYATESKSKSKSRASTSQSKVKTTGEVNLRTGAGLDYRSIRVVPKNTTLSYDEKKKDDRGVAWYHVTYKGKSGWISSKFASKK